MEYESDGEIKERAYRMHEMGGANSDTGRE